MERRGFFSRVGSFIAGLFGAPLVASATTLGQVPAIAPNAIDDSGRSEILSRIAHDEASFLRFNELPNGSLRLGGADVHNVLRTMPNGSHRLETATFGHTMFGEQGATVTAAELNWWALQHDGIIDYDEFLLWKIEHPGHSYINSDDAIRDRNDGGKHYMQGGGSRHFLATRL